MSTESDIESSTRAATEMVLTTTSSTDTEHAPQKQQHQQDLPAQATQPTIADIIDDDKGEVEGKEDINNKKTDEIDASNNTADKSKQKTEEDKEAEEEYLNKNQQEEKNGATTIAIEQPLEQLEVTGRKDKMDGEDSFGNFKLLYVLAQLAGLTAIGLVGAWVGSYMGGVAGRGTPSLEFNWHPLFMTIGLIFLYGNSILIYRGFRNMRKKQLKLIHAGIHMAALVFTTIALVAVFDSHNFAIPPIANLYSIHSWLGLGAVIVFILQYIFGFVAYLVPGFKDVYKIAYMPLHIYFGLFGFVLAIAAAMAGLNEKLIFNGNYSDLPTGSVIGNLVGVFSVIFGALVVYLVTEPSYKRKPIPEDVVLLTGIRE